MPASTLPMFASTTPIMTMTRHQIGCISIYHGDFIEICKTEFDDSSFSTIFTDPPYGRQHLHLYPSLLRMAGEMLEPGGDLVSIFPQYCVPDIAAWTAGSGLHWRWLIQMAQFDGPHARLVNSQHNIEVISKSIGWWYKKGGAPDYRNVKDAYVNLPPGKKMHEWEQSNSWAEYGVSTFCLNRGRVMDPMCGTGTFLGECLKQGIPAVGIDIDPEQIERTINRLENIQAAMLPTADL